MNVLTNILSTYRNKDKVELPKRDLLLFAIAALREADRLEHDNTGIPGKVAIEYLLNTKYQIVENRQIKEYIKDALLSEIDAVINKVAAKYRIKRKGKQFIFGESLEPEAVTIIGPPESDAYADLYKAQTELEVLKIQLARADIQSSASLRLTRAIMDKEKEIKGIKLSLIKKDYFSHFDDQSQYNAIYRRSIGEEAKDAAKAGAVTGAIVGSQVGKHSAIKATGHDKARKQAKTAIDFLKHNNLKGTKELNSYVKAKQDLATSKKTLERAGQTRSSASEAAQKAREALKKLSKEKALGNKYKSQALAKLQKSGQKVLQKSVKSGAKGALVGAAAGLALYGAKKIADSKHEQLVEQLDKRIRQIRRK